MGERNDTMRAMHVDKGDEWYGVQYPHDRHTFYAKHKWVHSEECMRHCRDFCLEPAVTHGFDAGLCRMRFKTMFGHGSCVMGYKQRPLMGTDSLPVHNFPVEDDGYIYDGGFLEGFLKATSDYDGHLTRFEDLWDGARNDKVWHQHAELKDDLRKKCFLEDGFLCYEHEPRPEWGVHLAPRPKPFLPPRPRAVDPEIAHGLNATLSDHGTNRSNNLTPESSVGTLSPRISKLREA